MALPLLLKIMTAILRAGWREFMELGMFCFLLVMSSGVSLPHFVSQVLLKCFVRVEGM